MPVEEIAGGLLGAILRFFGWVLVEIILEILIRGLGSLLCKPFKKNEIDSSIEIIVGILAWVVLIFVCFKLLV